MDTVSTQPSESLASPEESPDSAFAGMIDQKASNTEYPLDRIDLEIDPDLLWNEETGILTEGDQVEKTPGILPFQNTVYRQSYENGISAEGELIYQSDQGAVLFRDKVSLCLGGDSYSVDMPQKSFQIEALDGAFEFRIFDDRSAESYPSLLLRNSGNDCLFTRVADGVQHRLIEKYTDVHLLTLDGSQLTTQIDPSANVVPCIANDLGCLVYRLPTSHQSRQLCHITDGIRQFYAVSFISLAFDCP